MGSLAVTYFRERKLTIIGALLFHGPVREGKGWYQKAMSARRNLYAGRGLGRQAQNGDRRLFVVTAFMSYMQCYYKVIGSSRTGN